MGSQPTLLRSLAEHWHIARVLRHLTIQFNPDRCTGYWECYEVCPVDCWTADYDIGKVVLSRPQACIACRACVLQCPEGAIKLSVSDD